VCGWLLPALRWEFVHVNADELSIKNREYKLEKWKVFLSILTPVILSILTYEVSVALKKEEAFLKRQEQILAEKQRIYADLGQKLNVFYIYVVDIGDFSSYTPPQIIKFKRDADRQFWMYLPYWSDTTEKRYNDYMNAAFRTYNGPGLPAKINASKYEKIESYKHGGMVWDSGWDEYFTEKTDSAIKIKYYALVTSLLSDIANAEIRTPR
jgi:hypothetical protein